MKPPRVLSPRSLSAVAAAITYGATLPAAWADPTDAFAPIQASTASDPAGAQLMFVSIALLFVLVFSIFAGTMYYMFTGKKNRKSTSSNVSTESSESTGANPGN